MNRDRSAAIFDRIGSYGRLIPALIQKLRMLRDAPDRYRREAHYMRGLGPKWREKHRLETRPEPKH
ncbi:hypothetical protein [Rhodopseudomonas telluris]|uniref:Uncharacterized protein n=1 Tax=Rhodopseudomonas telluris TaxID=644215 RepID=A0ABV6EU00_9BRAD